MQGSKQRPREQVLIVAYADGYIEVFGEKHIDVRIEHVPSVDTPDGPALAEDYIDATLPARYADLHWPGNLRKTDMIRKVRPSDLAKLNLDMALLDTLNDLTPKPERRRTCTL